MPPQPVAEYVFKELFIFKHGPLFVTHAMHKESSFANLYKFPNILIESFPLGNFSSSQNLSVSLSGPERVLKIKSEESSKEWTCKIDPIHILSEPSSIEDRLAVKQTIYKENCLLPTVYIQGHRAFTIKDEHVHGFYYSSDKMKIYTYNPDISTIKEYSLFVVEKIHPNGFCFLYPEHMAVHLPTKSYTLPIEYTVNTDVSLFYHRNTLHSIFSGNGLIMHKNQFKKYPDKFVPSKVWNKYYYIYLFSKDSSVLLVLNRKLEIEYELSASNVFVTDEYVFVSKKERTIAHDTKTFSFAFLIEDFSISDNIREIRQFKNTLIVVSLEKIAMQSHARPLFSFFVTEIDLIEKTVKKMTPVLSNDRTNNDFSIFSLSEEIGTPYITEEISDVAFIMGEDGYLGVCVSSICVYVVWPGYIAPISISMIKNPFLNQSTESGNSLVGAPIQISIETGTLFIVGDKLTSECIFPALLLLCISSALPIQLLFSLFSDVAEYKTSIEKTLFHFLHNDNIEEAIDLIDAVKYKSLSMYEEVISIMLRLLDENNTEKLYSLIDRNEIKDFTCAVSLSRALINDFSLFERFLDCAIVQRREDLVFEFIEFVQKIDDPQIHHKILASLLKKNMLYISGMFLSKVEIESEKDELSLDLLVETYTATNKILQTIKDTKEPAEVLERVFTGSNPLLIAMVAERLSLVDIHHTNA